MVCFYKLALLKLTFSNDKWFLLDLLTFTIIVNQVEWFWSPRKFFDTFFFFFKGFLDFTLHKVQQYSHHFMILSTEENVAWNPRPGVRGKKIFLLDKF